MLELPTEIAFTDEQAMLLDWLTYLPGDILTKVDRSIYHPPMILEPNTPINEVTHTLKAHGIDAALVKLNDDDPRLEKWPSAHPYAIVTRTNMLHSVMLDGCALNTPVGDIATFPVYHVDDGDFFNPFDIH